MLIIPEMPIIPIIPPRGMDGSDFFRRVGQVRGGVGGFGRKRKSSERRVEVKGKKSEVMWVSLAYRELIGSLYESWTMGIDRVYKKLINTIIQQ